MPLEIGLFISLIKFRYFSFLRTALLLRLDSKPAVNCRTYGHFDDDDDYYYYYYYQVFLNANYVFVSIISIGKEKRFVSKQGQRQPHVQSKAGILSLQL